MSFEESYLRSFVAAVAAAAAVAFLAPCIAWAWRKRLSDRGLGIVGGLSLALAWVTAHLVFRGTEVWADLVRGGNGWKRTLWPIEATDRFHVAIACALAGGAIASIAGGPKGRGARALVWTVRAATLVAIAWIAGGPIAESVLGVIVVCAVCGVAWWAALEDAVPAPSGALMPITGTVCAMGFGALMVMQYAATLGLVTMCGAAAMCVLAIWGARDPRFTSGPMVSAVISGGLVWLVASSQAFAETWPAPAFGCACVAPLTPALFGVPWLRKRPAWNRWVVQLVVAGVMMGVGVGWVFWIEHGLRFDWPY